MKYIFGIVFILFIGLILYGVRTQQDFKAEAQSKIQSGKVDHQGLLNGPSQVAIALLKDKCVRCHGAVKNGKKRIKGKFDLTPFMQADRLVDDSAWAKVIDQIKNNTMPPEDGKVELSDKEGLQIVEMLENSFKRKTLPKRTLTSHEIGHSMSHVFKYFPNSFDPFETLRFTGNEGKEYSTVHASDFITPDFLREVEFGIGLITKHFVLPDNYGIKKQFQDIKTTLKPYEKITGSMTFIDIDYKAMKEEQIKSGDMSKEKWKEIKNAQSKRGKRTRFDIRTSLENQQIFSGKYLKKDNFPAGRYRVTFKATALNRHMVNKAFEAGTRGLGKKPHANKYIVKRFWSPKHQEDWKQLLHEEARLEFKELGYLSDIAHRAKLVTVPGSKKGRILGSVLIKDNVEKEYSFEFELKMRSPISYFWANGPKIQLSSANPQYFLNLNGLARNKGNGAHDRAGADYNLPCIRILSEIKIEQISNGRSKNEFDFGDEKNVTDALAKNKIDSYIKELSLEHNAKQLNAEYDKLPDDMSVLQKYETMLRLITISPDHLFIDFSSKVPNAKLRYVSYSLLKTHPAEEFKKDYNLFNKGKLTSKQFTKKIVDNPHFHNFIRLFVKGWMGLGTQLDAKKFTKTQQKLPFEKESIEYLNFLFTRNRPAKELYDSDYKLLDITLANYYKVKNPDGLQRYKFSPVKIKGDGVLSQANFFISHSSGVDPLPFARAKWASENVFDRKIPEPPNNVDAEEFVATSELKTFKERTAVHAQSEACKSCHKLLDPIAFAMHNFDTIGSRITTQDKEAEAQLRRRIVAADREMATAFTRELLSFTVGRKTTVYDSKVIKRIVKTTAKSNYALRDILAEIIEEYFKG